MEFWYQIMKGSETKERRTEGHKERKMRDERKEQKRA
jgi:hypothetical protein